jgi:hypothetical protein
VKFATANADVNPPEAPLKPFYDDKTDKKRVTGPVTFAIDGKAETAWGFDLGPGRRNTPHEAVFVFEQPVRNAAGTILTIRLAQNHGGWNSDDNQNCNLGRFRLSVTGAFEPVADPIPRGVREVLAIAPEKRTEAQMRAEFRYWCTLVPEWAEANAGIEDLWKQHPEPASQLVLQARAMPRTTSILHRGDFLKPTKDVDPGVPGFLNSEARGTPQDRLEFARWLVDRRAPTTARAIVNRVWQAYFGTGLVETPEDLGSQGSPSSHPELLDWLAVEFMENGWSLKALHRVIVGSATYRQSSHASAELEARDTANRLLARGARFRADAEVVRDIALAASGLLDDTVGGPSVNPPAPDFLFQPPASYGPKVWNEDKGPGRYRRALYTFRYRSVPYPMLQTFDAPNGDIACVRRSRSNTPLQALTVLNEPIFLECARALGLDALNQGGETDDERLVHAFRRCVARAPTDAERQTLLGLLERQKAHFGSGERDPWALAANDPANPPALRAGAMPADAAAWTAVARVLLNLDETISKE